MKFSLTKFLMSVSTALDFIEIDLLTKATNHGKRVALMSCAIGKALNLSEFDLFDLSAYALMHDNGVAVFKSDDESNAESGTTGIEEKKVFEFVKSHCVAGEENLKTFPFFNKKDNVILYHHESYDGSGFFSMSGNDIPLFSQIIHISDFVDILRDAGLSSTEIMADLKKDRGVKFLSELVDIFEEMQSKPSFNPDLSDMFINSSLNESLPDFETEMDYPQLMLAAEVFGRIIDSKSKFTARHSKGIAEKIKVMADYYKFDPEQASKITIAAHLHDLGKLAVPNSILDKPGALDSSEFETIQLHTYFTRKILSQITGFEDITEWASNHHEKLNGRGYPYRFDKSRLDFCSRLMACIDIYQALTEARPYRDGLSHAEASQIMRSCAGKEEIDTDIVEDVIKVFA